MDLRPEENLWNVSPLCIPLLRCQAETFDEVRKSAADMDTFVAEMKKKFPGLA
jgi:hypothetical protein